MEGEPAKSLRFPCFFKTGFEYVALSFFSFFGMVTSIDKGGC